MSESILAVREIMKSFGAVPACRQVSIDLKKDEIHALIGPNGAGKSTLIKQICGDLAPDSGTIHFLGEDVTDLDVAMRARMGLGRSFQISSVISEFTVLQNIVLPILGKNGHVMRFFRPAFANQSCVDFARQVANRVALQDRLSVRAGDLAHGERRRLEIAMALALRPQAFLLDEPMAGMGPEGTKQMTGLLRELRSEAPILLVEHDMDAVFALADRISVLVNGEIIASGTVGEIRNNAQVRLAYLGEEE